MTVLARSTRFLLHIGHFLLSIGHLLPEMPALLEIPHISCPIDCTTLLFMILTPRLWGIWFQKYHLYPKEMAFSLRNTTLLTNMWHFRPEILFLSPKVAFSPRNTICSQIDDLFPPTVRRFLPQMPVCFGIPPISSLRDYVTLRTMTFSPEIGHFLADKQFIAEYLSFSHRNQLFCTYVAFSFRNSSLSCTNSRSFQSQLLRKLVFHEIISSLWEKTKISWRKYLFLGVRGYFWCEMTSLLQGTPFSHCK